MREIPLVMPKMSMTMTEGILVAWHKEVGEAVRSGDVVCEVTTDKVDMEVEAPVEGVLARLVAEPEDVVAVGEPIAFIAAEADDLLAGLLDGSDPEPPAAGSSPAGPPPAGPPPAGSPPAEPPAGEPPAADAPAAGPPAAGSPAVDTPAGPPVADAPAAESPVDPPGRQAGPPAAGSSAGAPVTGRAESPSAAAPRDGAGAPTRSAGGWIPSVPRARGLARELGVDLTTLTPTGPGGVVRVADVETAASRTTGGAAGRSWQDGHHAANPLPHGGHAAKITAAAGRVEGRPSAAERRRSALARKMTESAAVPQFVVFRDLDLEALVPVRGSASWTAVLLRAYAAALREDPRLLATWDGERARPLDEVAVAVAVDTPDGLIAPVLADPDLLPLDVRDARLRALDERARRGKLAVADLRPAGTTVSNLGGMGVESFTALLTPPQATALSLGAVEPRVVAVPGAVVARWRCRVGLSVDHRVADGADAARLLARLQQRCQDPARAVR